jgi:hypothetical protein
MNDIVQRLAVYTNHHGIRNPCRTQQDRDCEEAMHEIIKLRLMLREQMDKRQVALDRCDRLLNAHQLKRHRIADPEPDDDVPSRS